MNELKSKAHKGHSNNCNSLNLRDVFVYSQAVVQANLELCRGLLSHPVMKGEASETCWIEFLKQYLPMQYGVERGKVIDSKGNMSDQIDIIIYDKLFSPYILNGFETKLLPVESVYAVFEVKQDIKSHISYASKKIASVRRLVPSFLNELGTTCDDVDVFPIIGGILTFDCTLRDKSVEHNLKKLHGEESIDIGCCVNWGSFLVRYASGQDNLQNIGRKYGLKEVTDVKCYSKDTALFSFVYQLLFFLERSKKKSAGLIVDIDAYLENINAEISSTSICSPLF